MFWFVALMFVLIALLIHGMSWPDDPDQPDKKEEQ